ncbi:Molybdenum ABC transporter2C periplasmic [Campylobacter concisus UNSWCD]|nr:Molybdenum ABC transporter2C periplasmic [Campylobacter concisus UNSWCD]
MNLCKKQNLEGKLKDKILAVAGVTQVVTYILSGEVDADFINQTELNAHKDEFGSFF